MIDLILMLIRSWFNGYLIGLPIAVISYLILHRDQLGEKGTFQRIFVRTLLWPYFFSTWFVDAAWKEIGE